MKVFRICIFQQERQLNASYALKSLDELLNNENYGDWMPPLTLPNLPFSLRIMGWNVTYDCQRCAACCKWPGLVRVTESEIAKIAQFLQMDEYEFIQKYTRIRPHRDGLGLIEKPNAECIFLEGNSCTIQAVKPGQCSDFPNRWNFPGWRESCEAIPRLVAAPDA